LLLVFWIFRRLLLLRSSWDNQAVTKQHRDHNHYAAITRRSVQSARVQMKGSAVKPGLCCKRKHSPRFFHDLGEPRYSRLQFRDRSSSDAFAVHVYPFDSGVPSTSCIRQMTTVRSLP
jgi:hypothetical protein